MSHRGIRYSFYLILSLLVINVGAASGEGVRHVKNSSTPRDGIRTVVLKELWRVGQEQDGVFFGRVPRVETDSQGNVYILDAQLCQVHSTVE